MRKVTDGRITSALQTALDAACSVLLSGMSSGGVTFSAGLLPAGGSFEPFTELQVRSRILTQRSRQVS